MQLTNLCNLNLCLYQGLMHCFCWVCYIITVNGDLANTNAQEFLRLAVMDVRNLLISVTSHKSLTSWYEMDFNLTDRALFVCNLHDKLIARKARKGEQDRLRKIPCSVPSYFINGLLLKYGQWWCYPSLK